MDSKKISELTLKISEFLENQVQEGVMVIKYKDESMESDGIKVDGNLLIQEIDGELVLERIIELPSSRFDPGDTIYEELATVATIEELLPILKEAFLEEQEEKDALGWLDYENEIDDGNEEEEDDDL